MGSILLYLRFHLLRWSGASIVNCSMCKCFPKTTPRHSVSGIGLDASSNQPVAQPGWIRQCMLCLRSILLLLLLLCLLPCLGTLTRPQILQRSSPASTTPTATGQVTLVEESRQSLTPLTPTCFPTKMTALACDCVCGQQERSRVASTVDVAVQLPSPCQLPQPTLMKSVGESDSPSPSQLPSPILLTH